MKKNKPTQRSGARQGLRTANIFLHLLLALCYLLFVGCDTLEDDIAVIRNKAEEKETRVPISFKMVPVEGGTFTLGRELGTAGSGDIENSHEVTLSSFQISNILVTQEQWAAVMEGNNNGISSKPSYFLSNPAAGETQTRRPVERVSWYDTLVFCNRLSLKEGLTSAYRIKSSTVPDQWGQVPTEFDSTWNAVEIVTGSTGYRLPTEAQWEYAAKGGLAQEPYTYSGSDKIGDVAWYSGNSGSKTHEAGRKKANKLGLYDMSGNVWEWCWDLYGGYTNTPKTDPLGASSGSDRVFRGGDWSSSATFLRSVNRYYYDPYYRGNYIGFRLARP